MSWSNILGQDRVKKILCYAIRERKIAGAYLLLGNEGVGKEALAIEFAKTVNCDSPQDDGNLINACGVCNSCKMFHNLAHPNLSMVFALPAGKATDSKSDSPYSGLSQDQIEIIQDEIEAKSHNFYHKIAIPNATQIKIASIREIKRDLSMPASQSGRRIIIISRADEMTIESSNAFLKTLEEPAENTTIFLTSAKHQVLTQTILSRTQQIHCQPLDDSVIESVLLERHSLTPGEAKLISAFAQGSYLRALEFLNEDIQNKRLEIVEILRSAMKKNTYRTELSLHFDSLLKSKEKNILDTVLNLLLLWLRDAYIIVNSLELKYMINIDQAEILNKFTGFYIKADYPAAIEAVEKAISLIKRNVNPQLILITLFLKLREIFIDNNS